ncbi:MAG: FliO/MopB family protein [Pyrinomonadaceae bacterium]
MFFSLALVCNSQPANTTEQKPQNTEIMGENDRVSFMQTGETPEAQEPGSGGLLLKTIGAMLLIVGLIFAGAWLAKKVGVGGSRSNGSSDEMSLAILSSVSLGNGRTISTVRFGERVLLVGSTTQAFTLLGEEKPFDASLLHNSRSVAEMLEEENDSFGSEFDRARTKLGLWEERGETD